MDELSANGESIPAPAVLHELLWILLRCLPHMMGMRYQLRSVGTLDAMGFGNADALQSLISILWIPMLDQHGIKTLPKF
jgi:hypothetical protein